MVKARDGLVVVGQIGAHLRQVGQEVGNDDVFEAFGSALASMKSEKVGAHLIARWKEPKKKKLMLRWEQKVLVLDAFKEHEGASAAEGTALGIGDAHPDVVRGAVAIAGGKEDKRVVTALVVLLQKLDKQGGTLYFAARQALVELTGEDFFSGKKWKAWWEGNKDGFDFTKKGKKTARTSVEKICSPDLDALEREAQRLRGDQRKRCRTCLGS